MLILCHIKQIQPFWIILPAPQTVNTNFFILFLTTSRDLLANVPFIEM